MESDDGSVHSSQTSFPGLDHARPPHSSSLGASRPGESLPPTHDRPPISRPPGYSNKPAGYSLQSPAIDVLVESPTVSSSQLPSGVHGKLSSGAASHVTADTDTSQPIGSATDDRLPAAQPRRLSAGPQVVIPTTEGNKGPHFSVTITG